MVQMRGDVFGQRFLSEANPFFMLTKPAMIWNFRAYRLPFVTIMIGQNFKDFHFPQDMLCPNKNMR